MTNILRWRKFDFILFLATHAPQFSRFGSSEIYEKKVRESKVVKMLNLKSFDPVILKVTS